MVALTTLWRTGSGAPGALGGRRVTTHQGGCHCGQVRFEVEAPETIEVDECNCSICAKFSYRHLIVPKSRFRLLSGRDSLTSYRFNTNTAEHLFCSVCGVKSFYVPRSHPNGYSVNARCLDPRTIKEQIVRRFDGQNWEAHAHELGPVAE